jgi:RuvA, C-terminal domain
MVEASTSALDAPDAFSPEGLHEYLVRAHRLENQIRWKFLQALLSLDEGLLFRSLGCATLREYTERFFGWERTRTYEALRVARALGDLPRTREAFISGLAYSRVEEITRIASRETEDEWIAFAETSPLRRLKLEVSDAKRTNRKRPRPDQYSLPAERRRLPFDFSPDEFTLLFTALKKWGEELAQSLGGEKVLPKAALLHLAQVILDSDPGTVAEGRIESDRAAYQILYRHCPRCRLSHVETEDGPMEIEAEAIERCEHAAEKHVIRPEEELPSGVNGKTGEERPPIDRPNTRPFLEKLSLRDGKRCANPFCRRRMDHGHHVTERSEGGRTELHNECGFCRSCHSLITVGLLEVSGNPIDGFIFTPKAAKLSPGLSVEKAELEGMPHVTAPSREAFRYPDGEGGDPSGYPDTLGLSPDEAQAFEDATLGLETLGWKKKEAPPRARRALDELRKRGEKVTAESLLRESLRAPAGQRKAASRE